MQIKLVASLVSVLFFILVIELIRREKMTFKYALMWLLLSLAAIALTVYEHLLFFIARKIGFELPSNFIFFVISLLFVFLSLFLTVYICQQNSRSDILAQKTAILEEELARLKKKQ